MRLINYFIVVCILLASVTSEIKAQGEFAGSRPSSLIGRKFNNDRVLHGLPGYEYRHVTLAGENDPEQYSVGVYQKKNTWLIFFALNEDTTSDLYTIQDVLDVKHVGKSETINTVVCTQKGVSDFGIVALSDNTRKVIRSWKFNRNLKRFELMDNKGVECAVEE